MRVGESHNRKTAYEEPHHVMVLSHGRLTVGITVLSRAVARKLGPKRRTSQAATHRTDMHTSRAGAF